jgi:hypothetical protein
MEVGDISMSDTTEVQETPQEKVTPAQFLQQFGPNAPTEADLTSWKAQSPGNRIRIQQTTDLKRVFVLRGLGGSELAKITNELNPNIPQERVTAALQSLIACRCCHWTNTTVDGKLTELQLSAAGAGLPQTLNIAINDLSDYCDPDTIQRLSIEI